MNRSILIVICDFLLVSLLVFSSVDINKVTQEGTARNSVTMNFVTNQYESAQDLTAAMRLALDEERQDREALVKELSVTRTTVSEREKRLEQFQLEIRNRDQTARQLQEDQMRLQQQQARLQQQYATAQTNIQTLSRQLQNTSSEALLSKEKLAEIEAEAKKRAEEAAQLQQQLDLLARSNQMVLNEKQQLSTKLQIAEVEKKHAAEQVARMSEQVQIERAEKAKLAEGVQALASKSVELEKEIRENRPLAPNAIFSDFLTNRVTARFEAFKSGLFGTARSKQTDLIVVSNGTNNYALCHAQETPFNLPGAATDWDSLTGTIGRAGARFPIQSISFQFTDPRITWIQVSASQAAALGCKVYPLSSDPYKFQDAVLVGAREGYYGECRFQIDPAMPEYVRLDTGFIRGLFGKFNPSRGDLVFSRTGELLGIMVNGEYCMVLRSFDPTATLKFGDDLRFQRTAEMLSALDSQVMRLPSRLQ